MKTSRKYLHHANIPLLSKPLTTSFTVPNLASITDTHRSIGSTLTKRHRTETACDICRRRKVRCDLQQNGLACKQCIHAGAVCTVTTRPRKRGTRGVLQLEERLERMEQLLAKRLQDKDKSTSPIDSHLGPKNDRQKIRASDETAAIEHPRPEESINSINDWIYRMCGIDKLTSDALVKIYFAYVYPVFPVVNKTSFMQQYRGQAGPLPSPPLLCAMYGASVRYIESHRAFRDGSLPPSWDLSSQQPTAEAWAQRHMNYVKRNQTPCLSIIQSLLVSMQHLCGAYSKWTDVWLLNSVAIRMAQDIGLHRHDQSHSLSETDKETRSQLWGLLYILDRWFSAGTGRPLTAFDEDCDQVCSESRNLESSSHHPSMTPLDDTILAINYSKLPLFEAVAQITKVSRILGKIIHGVYTPAARKRCMENGSANIVALLEGALGSWRRNLPPFLKITITDTPTTTTNDDGSVAVLSGIVGMCYYTSLILLHRPFIGTKSSTSPSSQISLQICTNSAIRMVDIMVKLQYKDHLLVSWSFIIYPMFVASLIHVYNANSTNSMVADVARANLWRILTTLQTFGKLSPLAEKLHAALHCVAEQRHYLPYGLHGQTKPTHHHDTLTQDCNSIIDWLDNICTPLSNTDPDPFGLYSLVEFGLSECPYHPSHHLPQLSASSSTSSDSTKPTLPSLSLHMDRPLYDDFMLYGSNPDHPLPITPSPAKLGFYPGNIFWDLPSGMQLNEWPNYPTNVVSTS